MVNLNTRRQEIHSSLAEHLLFYVDMLKDYKNKEETQQIIEAEFQSIGQEFGLHLYSSFSIPETLHEEQEKIEKVISHGVSEDSMYSDFELSNISDAMDIVVEYLDQKKKEVDE